MQKAPQVQTQFPPEANLPEQAGYFAVPGANLYAVLHPVTAPIARVLLVGAFASERHFSYHAWVRWARYLAARRVEVLRYDYRGIGESTGLFEEMSFEDWGEDVKILADQFARRSPRVPLVLHGLELGAILAARRFHEGTGDGLLLWSAPANANQVLYSGKNGRRAAQASAVATPMIVMDQKRSSPPLSSAFQEAWSSAARRTSAVRGRVMGGLCHVPSRAA